MTDLFMIIAENASSLIRLDPGGRRVKSRVRTGNVTAFIPENSAYKHASSVRLMPLVDGGSQWESAQLFKVGPFALVKAYAVNTHRSQLPFSFLSSEALSRLQTVKHPS